MTACPRADESSGRVVSLKGGLSGRAVGFLQGVATGLLSEGDRPSGRPALKLTRCHNVPSARKEARQDAASASFKASRRASFQKATGRQDGLPSS